MSGIFGQPPSPVTTPVVDNFISAVDQLIVAREGDKLQDYLQIEPEWPPIYHQMVAELRATYPVTTTGDKAADDANAKILEKCEVLGRETDKKAAWIAFPAFMRMYLTYLRDVDVTNLLDTYNLLNGLLNQCVIALGDSQMGVILLPTVLYLSKTLSKLAIGLDKRPELIAHLLKADPASDGSVEATETVTLVEKSANIVREAFIKCLTDRTGVIGRPEGKRKGIYLMANLCLKLLFKCGKLRNAEQMFASIQAHSPPLSMFPAAQRVTYLYYLGRYLFSNNLFWPAKIALETAYTQCHRQAFAQRRKILVHLISTNIILGRFPSSNLLQRPEATSLAPRFLPLCKIIASGDVPYFRAYLAPGSPHAEWFSQKGVLLQLRNRCEILVWRSLTRKVFIADGFHGQDPNENQNQRGPPPFVWLWKIEAAANWLEERQQEQRRLDVEQPQAETCGTIFKYPQDPEFARQDRAARGGQFDTDEFEDYLHPTAHYTEAGEWSSNNPNPDVPQDQNYPSDIDPFSTLPPPSSADLLSSKQEHTSDSNGYFPSTSEIEAILSSLLTQDLLHGYLTHKNPRFAIPGAKTKGALATGWPNVWRTIETRESADAHVPGWVRSPAELKSASNAIANARAVSASPGPALGMGGRVVNLSGARPVGSGM